MSTQFSASPTMGDFPSSVESVLGHLRESTSLPNWALTRNGAAGPVVLHSSAQTAILRGRPTLDRRRHAEVLSAPIFDELDGTTFGRLVGYVTDRDVQDIADLEAVHRAVKARAAVHQPLVDLLASLLASALAVDRMGVVEARTASRAADYERDPVTGLVERAAWSELLAGESVRLHRLGDPAALVFVDLVAFNRIQAESGPDAANVAARRLGLLLSGGSIADTDLVARLRSREFAALLVGSDAAVRALSLCRAVAELPFETNCGMAEHTNATLSLSDTASRADAALNARSVSVDRVHPSHDRATGSHPVRSFRH